MKTLKYLYILACFVTGAAMMIIEVSGIRLLAPVFGNSLYVWTALIGVVLVGFSLGGFLGGYLADRTTTPSVIITTLILSAAFIILIPTLHALSGISTREMSPLYGPTVLSAILFLIPGSLLGIINPYATRLLAKLTDDKKIGAATGAANVASALGSFLGTFIAGFYLVPQLDVRFIFLLTALVLVLLAIAIKIKGRHNIPQAQLTMYSMMVVFPVIITFGIKPTYDSSVVDVRDSKYQQIIVFEDVEDGIHTRKMVNNGYSQGSIDILTGEISLYFQNYWKIVQQYTNKMDNALMIGGGTYGVPQSIVNTYPGVDVSVVEIDEEVTDVAFQYFNLDKYPSINIFNSDARWFSNNDNKTYDYIYLDAYNGTSAMPSHLTTVEYFNTLKKRLSPEGYIMVNTIGNVSGPTSEVFGAFYKTLSSVFGEVNVYKTPMPTKAANTTNLILLASSDGVIPEAKYSVSDDIQDYVDTLVSDSDIKVSESPIMTDYLNPIDVLSSELTLNMEF